MENWHEKNNERVKFHPASWNFICWISLAVWIIPTVHVLWPPSKSPIPRAATGGEVYLATSSNVGFPFGYLRVSSENGETFLWTWNYGAFSVNVFLLGINLLCLVFACQSFFDRFSVSKILSLTVFLGVYFFAVYGIFSTNQFWRDWYASSIVFLTPMPLALWVAVSQSIFRSSSNTWKNNQPTKEEPW